MREGRSGRQVMKGNLRIVWKTAALEEGGSRERERGARSLSVGLRGPRAPRWRADCRSSRLPVRPVRDFQCGPSESAR